MARGRRLRCRHNHQHELRQQEGASEHQKVVGDLLRTLEFRQALSIAIDRDEIWNSAFLGFGEPRQMAPMQWSPYYEEGMETPFIEFDPERASQMLDDLGLDQRDSDGFRLGPDGQPVDLTIAAVDLFGPWVDTAQLVNNHWNAVGLKCVVSVEERSLYTTRQQAGEHQVDVWNSGGNGKVLIYPYWVMPYSAASQMAPLSGNWYESGGQSGIEPTGDLRRVIDLFDQAQVTPTKPSARSWPRRSSASTWPTCGPSARSAAPPWRWALWSPRTTSATCPKAPPSATCTTRTPCTHPPTAYRRSTSCVRADRPAAERGVGTAAENAAVPIALTLHYLASRLSSGCARRHSPLDR